VSVDDGDSFEEFVTRAEPRLRHALVAALGVEHGTDATCEALAYAWQHWTRVKGLEHPVPYLYKVGRSAARRYRRPLRPAPPPSAAPTPWIEPALERGLSQLTDAQRLAVVLVHGFQWTYQEVADLAGVERSTVQSHLERGLAKLRVVLEVDIHA
jgi:RNA polymerase sigma factor (sigma-70 family)